MTADQSQIAQVQQLADELMRCREWIQSALDEGGNTHSFEDIVRGVAQGHYQFWPADRCCAITEVVEYPNRKSLHIFLAAGDKEQIKDMNASAEEFARAIGCDSMSIAGRRGWVRELKRYGYFELLTTVVKPLEPEGAEDYNTHSQEG